MSAMVTSPPYDRCSQKSMTDSELCCIAQSLIPFTIDSSMEAESECSFNNVSRWASALQPLSLASLEERDRARASLYSFIGKNSEIRDRLRTQYLRVTVVIIYILIHSQPLRQDRRRTSCTPNSPFAGRRFTRGRAEDVLGAARGRSHRLVRFDFFCWAAVRFWRNVAATLRGRQRGDRKICGTRRARRPSWRPGWCWELGLDGF